VRVSKKLLQKLDWMDEVSLEKHTKKEMMQGCMV